RGWGGGGGNGFPKSGGSRLVTFLREISSLFVVPLCRRKVGVIPSEIKIRIYTTAVVARLISSCRDRSALFAGVTSSCTSPVVKTSPSTKSSGRVNISIKFSGKGGASAGITKRSSSVLLLTGGTSDDGAW